MTPSRHVSHWPRDLVRYVASFVSRRPVERLASAHHPYLEVSLVRGRKILDGATVNYSFGGLHSVFAEAFRRVDVGKRDVRSVLVLGLGAGSVVHLLRRDHHVRAPITAVEIDPVMVDVARRHFGLDRWTNLEVIVGDAVAWTRASRRRFDLIVVDLFLEAEIPAACRTREFLESLRDRLSPGGLLLDNVVASRPDQRERAAAFVDRFRAALPAPRVLTVRGNWILAWERPRAESVVADPDSCR